MPRVGSARSAWTERSESGTNGETCESRFHAGVFSLNNISWKTAKN